MASLRCGEEMVQFIDAMIAEKGGEELSDEEVDHIVATFRKREEEMYVSEMGRRKRKTFQPCIGLINAQDVRKTERLYRYRHKRKLEAR